MKIKIQMIALLTLLASAPLNAQTEYGDGSLRLTGVYQESFNSSNSKFEASDSWRYEYNGLGKETRVVALGYSTISQLWNPWYVKVSEYDSKGNKITETDSQLVPAQFGLRSKLEMKYNSQSQEIIRTRYSWNTSNSKWEYYARYTNFYKQNGTLDTLYTENWDKNTSKFVLSQKEWFVYNSNQQVIEHWTSKYDANAKAWNFSWLEFKAYNSKGNITSYRKQGMHFVQKVWINTDLVEYDYNSEDKTSSIKSYNWNSMSNTWDYSFRENFVYSSNSYYSVSESYDKNTSKWVGSWKTTYVLLPDGWPAEIITQKWDVNSSAWVNQYKQGWDYNSNGYGIYRLSFTWDAAGSKWKAGSKGKYYYEASASTRYFASSDQIQLYPNPASENLSVKLNNSYSGLASVMIIDFSGKELKNITTEAVQGAFELNNISKLGLKTGTYLCRIQCGSTLFCKPLILK